MENLKSLTRRTVTTLSDPALYKLCKEYGKQSRKWAREFGFLLPEVARRNLHRKYGCASIQMFAAKLAGMNHEVVNRILNLHEKLIANPLLWAEFRRFGWSKLRVVAEVAEFESEEFWVDKLRRCPKIVLEEYVRRYREFKLNSPTQKLQLGELSNTTTGRESVNSNPQARTPALDTTHAISVPFEDGQTSLFSSNKTESAGTLDLGDEKNVSQNLEYTATANQKSDFTLVKIQSIQIPDPNYFKKLKFNVDPETEFLFREFKQKLEKEQKQAITMGKTLKELLKVVKKMQAENLSKVAEKQKTGNISEVKKVSVSVNAIQTSITKGQTLAAHVQNGFAKNKSHTAPAKIKSYLTKKYQNKCAFPDCNKPLTDFHHAERFSITHKHKNIYPLCRLHHQAIHSGLIKNEDQPIENWRMDFGDEEKLDKEMNLSGIESTGGEEEPNFKNSEQNSANKIDNSTEFSDLSIEASRSQLTKIFTIYNQIEKAKIDQQVRGYW